MPGVFLLIALLLAALVVLLYVSERRLLNFVEYGPAQRVAAVNRHAALRLLLPVFAHLGCAVAAWMRPQLEVPLLLLTPLSILGAVVWIAAGVDRVGLHAS